MKRQYFLPEYDGAGIQLDTRFCMVIQVEEEKAPDESPGL